MGSHRTASDWGNTITQQSEEEALHAKGAAVKALRLLEDQWKQRLEDALAAAKNDQSELNAMVMAFWAHGNVDVSLSHRRGFALPHIFM